MNLIQLPVVDMREAPLEKSKVVSQALFGEEIQVLKLSKRWAQIRTPDHYAGWVKEGSFIQLQSPYQPTVSVTRLKAHIYEEKDTEFGPLFSLPYGSPLQVVDVTDPRWAAVLLPNETKAYIQKGDIEGESFPWSLFLKQFLGIPYTWGGRSSFGFDCSGFVQRVFFWKGISLPRDARLQIQDPRAKEISFSELKEGSLIFWGKSPKEIRHVGIFLEGNQFIHTSPRENKPYVRISHLDDFEWSGDQRADDCYRCFIEV